MTAWPLLLLLLVLLSCCSLATKAEQVDAAAWAGEEPSTSLVCDLCDDVMNWIDGQLAPNATAPEIDALLREGCDYLFSSWPSIHSLVRHLH